MVLPLTVSLLAMQQARLFEAFCYQRYAAGLMHIGGDEIAARFQIAEQRSFIADAIKVFN